MVLPEDTYHETLNKNQTKQKNGACFNQHRPTTFHCYKLKEKNLNLFLKETQTRRQTFLCGHCRGSKEATVSSKGDMGWKVYIFVKYLYQQLILNCSGTPSHPQLDLYKLVYIKVKVYNLLLKGHLRYICQVWN